MTTKNISIAIDGPAGAGKSTIAKLIAKAILLTYLDTGAMYRAITLKILKQGTDLTDLIQISTLLNSTKIDIVLGDILLDGKNVTEELRSPEINQSVSEVAQIPLIREKMVDLQRKIAADKDVIMDGRDIGTTVLPQATYKFFVTASIEERAMRRFQELRSKGFDISFEEVKSEIEERDRMDSKRKVSPLRMDEEAILIDTTSMTIDEVVQKILSYIK